MIPCFFCGGWHPWITCPERAANRRPAFAAARASIAAPEAGPGFQGSASARILQLETAVMKARTALGPHRAEHERQVRESPTIHHEAIAELQAGCPTCYAADTLEEIDR